MNAQTVNMCNECLNNCDPLVTDKCTKYTGPTITALGTCYGDSIYEVDAIILQKLQDLLAATEINLEDLELNCPLNVQLFPEELSRPYTLLEVINKLLKEDCQLQTQISALVAAQPAPFSFDTACLTGTLTNRDTILQSVILKVCNIDTRLAVIEGDYVKQSTLCSQVLACLPTPSAVTDFNLRMVPYAPIPYIGPLSNFDNTGKGLASVGFDKVYLMNGLNGTEDWRGRSPIGAIQNVPGATLDPVVDPSLPANALYNYTQHTKYGKNSEVLVASQMPLHSHIVTDPGHNHSVVEGNNNNGGPRPNGYASNHSGGEQSYGTTTATTGISLGNAGGSQAHNNVQPSIACLYIIYIP